MPDMPIHTTTGAHNDIALLPQIRAYLWLAVTNAIVAVVLPTLAAVQQKGDLLVIQRQIVGIVTNRSIGVPQFGFLIDPLVLSIFWSSICFILMIALARDATRAMATETYSPHQARQAGWAVAHISMIAWILTGLLGGLLAGSDGGIVSIDRLNATPLQQQYGNLLLWIFLRASCTTLVSMIVVAPIIARASRMKVTK